MRPMTFFFLLAIAHGEPAAVAADPPILEPHRLLRTWQGSSATETMGFKIRDVGDVDGDAVRDFAMAATGRDNGSLERAGAIDVYSTATGRLLHSVPGHFSPGSFGNGIGFAGDVDGDGAPDVIAGSYDREGTKTGYAVVFSAINGLTHLVLRSRRSGDQFGIQAHGAGDLDGDGYDDVVVGAPTDDSAGRLAGRAYFFSGRTGEILFTLEGDRPGDEFGSAVSGDVYDRSGLFAVGARQAGPESRGRVYVYRMAQGRPKRLFTVEPLATSHELGAYFLSFLGDVDADGTPDLYAGDYADSAHGEESGRVHVVSGRTGERLLSLEGRSEWGGLGTGYGRVGDVDHDGHADVLAGSWRNGDGAEAGGAAFLYSGRDGRLLRSFTGRFAGRTFGHDAIGIGDVDGDGTIDFLITNAGNSGVLPREVGHVYLFSGSDEPGDGSERREAEPTTTVGAASRHDEPLAIARPSDSPSWSPDGSRICFSTWIEGDWEIAVMRADGSGLSRLTHNPGVDQSPAWSPDGRWIAFTSERGGDREIYRMRPDGSNAQRLTEMHGDVARPSYSPDGQHIVFNTVSADDTRKIFVVDTAGGEARQLTDAPAHSDWPWWSADGETIYFESNRTGVWQIYSMRPDGTGLRQVTHGSDVSAGPVSSPTGNLLVGHARRGNWEIVTWDADGTETNLTRHPAEDRMPAWSPDGERIAFISDRAGPFEIFVIDADGSNLRQLTRQDPGAIDLARVLREQGVEHATALYDRLHERVPDRPLFEEGVVNAYGYELLGRSEIEGAIAVFRLNVRAFPDSANVWDSLGEAVWRAGRPNEAIRHYERSLELDPGNDNARKMIRQLSEE